MTLVYGTEDWRTAPPEEKAEAVGFPKMNPHTKRKWVRALRSGKYLQGTGALFDNRKYPIGEPDPKTLHCCLAVLVCEARPDSVACLDSMALRGYDYFLGVEGRDGFIPDDLAMMWGLEMPVQELLEEMNDNLCWDFSEIADWVEEKL